MPVVAFLVGGLWWLLGLRQQGPEMGPREGKAVPAGVAAQRVAKTAEVASVRTVAGVVAPPEAGKQTALRMVLAGDTVELLARDELQGDFHQRRGRMAWLPGMLLCRLLDGQQRVLAEETLAAPDHACVVLAPQTAGMAAMPVATRFSSPAPVVFQVRLPYVAAATQLRVYRLNGPRPADTGAEPAGKLLGSIALQR